ncbi:ABC transporter ATP-binding protein [Halomonas binhaiensis]|uniref:ABC transporter ATP-binding protein n=1 Tax=Halomonas binhaiensis TaxID=2562282 RepID=A0A5C1NH90_9GAMM|nr:dipeptide/oligopeptide/nickel ABC transporter ATP-binding protein [Halomonas binhaiensis]QEM82280.1 ABC transporter ATP-binding protein [Halomonas binhaiensis]
MQSIDRFNEDGSLLSVTGLNKFAGIAGFWRRGTRRQILKNVSFQLFPGECIGLAGVSGAGKTTLLNLILALESADAGGISCLGKPIAPASVSSLRWYRRTVQYVPQDPASSLDPRMSVRDLVREPLARLRVDCNHDRRVEESLEQVGLESRLLTRRPGQLSGGQAQRVAIARAIAVRPKLLLADEPLSGLDLPAQTRVTRVLESLNQSAGIGLLIISHDLSVISRLCQRTIILDNGAIIEDRPTLELFRAPVHARTEALLQAAMTLSIRGSTRDRVSP